jgi:demethylmenaquinone methyltransferase/2-methoxy-6-polyprenyl-1,4-benzoquinol methylase
MDSDEQVDFGFKKVRVDEKAKLVGNVFSSVAQNYDLFNDIASIGLHRVWKKYAVWLLNINSGDKVLDIASGTGDLAIELSQKIGKSGSIFMTDINPEMLYKGRERVVDAGLNVPSIISDAENLPFKDQSFDKITIAFGLRNITNKIKALSEFKRVLKVGGKLMVLEFSKVSEPFDKIYEWYSFNILPFIGKKIVGNDLPYDYLAESIKMYPNPKEISSLMQEVGFSSVRYQKLSLGVVTIHQAFI